MKIPKIINSILPLLPILLIVNIFILPLSKPGLIVGGDWTFPSTNSQLRVFAQESKSLWSYREIPTGGQIPHQNLYLLQLFAGIWGDFGLDGISFQKTTLFVTIIGIYLSSYLFFFRLTKNKLSSVLGAISYLFSPLVFNYINMGWNYVLLFLALAPLFCLIAYDYLRLGGTGRLIALGYISAIGLFQSQSIAWFPILFFILFLDQLRRSNFSLTVLRYAFGIFTIVFTTFLVHLPWILPIIMKLGYSFTSTSVYDLTRFSSVTSFVNTFRTWGSLYNQQFELAYPVSLLVFSYFPIILIIYNIISDKTKDAKTLSNLVLGLILVAPIIYFFRDSIANLPYSSIIRDNSRFLVITSLGISLGIADAIRKTKSFKILTVVIIGLFLTSYPYFSGKLYLLNDNRLSSANGNKDFRLKLLNNHEEQNEIMFEKHNSQRNIFLPTGGFIFTKYDRQFNGAFRGIADTASRFSPYGTGIYYSDKSNPLVLNFTKTYFEAAGSATKLFEISKMYGIEHIFYRQGLVSTSDITIDDPRNNPNCQSTDTSGSDWDITTICPISGAYPLFYSSVTPQNSTIPMSELLKNKPISSNPIALIGCPDNLDMTGSPCSATFSKMSESIPKITVEKKSETSYLVRVENISGNFILVFNQTYHPGWILKDKEGEDLNYQHLLINQLVNGWLITPTPGESEMEVTVEFYPQTIYSRLLPWSLGFFVFLSVYLLSGLILKKRK